MIPKMITIHCSASPNGRQVSGNEIKKWHTDPPPNGRGFKDIGYHCVIEIDGGVYRGRAENVVGAHVEGHNTANLGVCLVGMDKFSLDQFHGLKWVLKNWMISYLISDAQLFAHCDWDTAKKQGKTCPNIPIDVIKRWLRFNDDTVIAPYVLDTVKSPIT
jgi:hypothetical protein